MGRIWPASTPDPEDRYTPEELRHLGALDHYPGPVHPLVPLAGISPRGGVAASISGLTVTARDLVGVAAPTEAPWTETNGGYRFVLYSEQLTIDPAHTSLERIDLLVARLTDQEIDGSGTRVAVPVIITGTPGSGMPAIESGDVHLSTITVPAGGSPAASIVAAGKYTVGLGAINTFPDEAAMPTAGLYSGQAAYDQATQALKVAHGGAWGTVGSRRGYQWGGNVRFTSSGAFVKANYPGVRAVRVKIQGGGGGGGGSRSTLGGATTGQASSSGGGGGGCYVEAVILASSLASSVAVTVGGGGTSPAGGPGNTGGASSFGSFVSAPGGSGGFDRQESTGHAASTGGAMSEDASITGHVTGTELVVRGGAGGGGYSFGNSVVSGATLDKGAYGHGGSSHLGGTGRGARGPSTAATPGQPYGGGGSGNVSGWTNDAGEPAKSGGAGAAGIVIVELLY